MEYALIESEGFGLLFGYVIVLVVGLLLVCFCF